MDIRAIGFSLVAACHAATPGEDAPFPRLAAPPEGCAAAIAPSLPAELLPGAIVALGFGIQCLATRGLSLGLDGGLSLALALVPVPDALHLLAADVHPPLYYVILRAWIALVGVRPMPAKFLGVASATLTTAIVMRWAARLAGRRAALAAGALLSVSPLIVADAATVRDLAPGLLFTVLNGWCYLELQRPRPRSTWQALYLASGVVALWTSFLTVGILIGQMVHALLIRREPSRLIPTALIALSIAPWLGEAIRRGWLTTLLSGGPTLRPTGPAIVGSLATALDLLLTGSSSLSPVAVAAVALALGFTIVPAWLRPDPGISSPLGAILLQLLAAVGFALVISSAWLRLDVPARYLAVALPFASVALGVLAARLPAWRAGLGLGAPIVAHAVALLGWYAQPALPLTFWNPVGVQRYLDQNLGPSDSVVFLTLEQAGYYAALSPRPHPWVAVPVGTSYLERDVRLAADEKLPSLITGPGSIWLVEYRGVLGAGQRTVETWLASHAFAAGSAPLSDSVVLRFITDAAVGAEHPVFRHFSDGVVLVSGAFPSPVHPGQPLPIRLRWQAAHPLRRDLVVFVHLVNTTGETVAQGDGPPAAGLAPTTRWQGLIVDRHGLIVPPKVRPGTYWIDVGLYDAAGRLEVVGRRDGVGRLGPVQIRVGPDRAGVNRDDVYGFLISPRSVLW